MLFISEILDSIIMNLELFSKLNESKCELEVK